MFARKPLALMVALTPCLAPALAQADEVTFEPVKVSADFRQNDVQALPEAVTVVSGQQVEQRSAQHLESVLALAPNVNFAAGASRGRFLQIRGIGERSQFVDPVNPSVGLMIDGIDMTGLGAVASLLDVEQVEVLRGPQGTRFGANALAGMINITSTAASKERSGYLKAHAGNYASRSLEGAVGGSLSDNAQGRLSARTFVSDGYVDNEFLDRDDTQNLSEKLLRLKLAMQPDAASEARLTYLYADIDNGYDAFNYDNDRTSLADEPGTDAQQTQALALAYERQLNSAVRLETLLSGSSSDSEYSYDEDWAYEGIHPDGYSSFDEYLRDYERLSADLRLLSGADGRLFANSTGWVVGLYLMQRDETLTRNYTYNDGPYDSDLAVRSASIYAEASAAFSPLVSLTWGARAERWRNDFSDSDEVAADDSETLWGGKLTLDVLLSPQHMGYASLARGYKAGGVNTDPDISEDNRTFNTEINFTTELGLKSSLLNDRLTTRVAAFYIQRRDQQVKSSYAIQNEDNSLTFQDYLANAAEGRNQGVELEANWRAHEQLDLALSAGYLDTEFVDYTYQTEGGEFSKDGRSQSHAPEYSAAAAMTYRFAPAWSLLLESEAKDAFYFSDSHDERSKSYVLWHARLSYQWQQLELALAGRNLTDAEVETRGFGGFGNDPRDGYASSRYVQLGQPRLVMAEAKYSF
ncbi:TonB-dependent receptor [Bacterioplanes sanyensis]|uniref:TonB-dependent receptor n=1 Tax=Bacterioplanes sanyensis TaxID=1249553 RepID=UPI001679ADA8|nr:TonB-dependent receptor [Bacterioplanes sanyensis]GGY49285.1 TonB-dependent receptor [Bacterioplanes sanyensis]